MVYSARVTIWCGNKVVAYSLDRTTYVALHKFSVCPCVDTGGRNLLVGLIMKISEQWISRPIMPKKHLLIKYEQCLRVVKFEDEGKQAEYGEGRVPPKLQLAK